MITCAQAIKEVFKNKDQVLTTKQIIDAVQKKYPNAWKEVTIRTHTMGCSVNHTSSKWYPSFPKFLYTVSPGQVRLYDPEKDGEFSDGAVMAGGEDSPSEEAALEMTLSLEKDLQEYLSKDIKQIEPGLMLYTEEGLTGREVPTDAGKIDILAMDKNGILVVIELKATKANYSTLGQILSYMASIKAELKAEGVRGIIIAEDFDKKLKYAVSEVPQVTLIKYRIKFDFEKAT